MRRPSAFTTWLLGSVLIIEIAGNLQAVYLFHFPLLTSFIFTNFFVSFWNMTGGLFGGEIVEREWEKARRTRP